MKAKLLGSAKIGLAILIGGSVAGWKGIQPSAEAQVGVSVGVQIQSPADFYTPLSPYGGWVNVSRYGRCWRPIDVPTGWRPYTVGHWEWTDCGWYWVSDEPWSWACYHYGCWVLDPVDGWVWVPGTEWAPAWVVWREAPDYIGWAPCGPSGVAFSDASFVFVDVHHFHDRLRPRELVFDDPRIFHRSRRVGGFRTETRDFDGMRRRIAFNQGPGIDPIQRATGTRFTARPVTEVARQTPLPESLRRNHARPESERERSRATPEQAPARTGREQQRLYREAPAQPAPTGRQQQRLYREAPTPKPAPEPRPAPVQPAPRRQHVPEVSPAPVVPNQRTLPPTGRESGRTQPRTPRREEPAPRVEQPAPRFERPAPRVEQPAPKVAPNPAPRQSPAPAPAPRTPPQERDRHQRGDGQ